MSNVCGMCGSTHHTFTPRPNRDPEGAICAHCLEEEGDATVAHGPPCRLPIDPVALEAMGLVGYALSSIDPYVPGALHRINDLPAATRAQLYRELREKIEGGIRNALQAVSGPDIEIAAPAPGASVPIETHDTREERTGCIMCGADHHAYFSRLLPDHGRCSTCGCPRDAACHGPKCPLPTDARGLAEAYGASAVMCEILCDETFESKRLRADDITDWLGRWRLAMHHAIDDAAAETSPTRKPQ